MNASLDMEASMQYLGHPSDHTAHLDLDPSLSGLPDASCASIAPSVMAYSPREQASHSEVSHLSPYGTSPVIDDHLLTPASTASSPQLQHRSARHPSLEHQEEPVAPCSQQPTPPPHMSAMYPYPDYMTTSSMPMHSVIADSSSHDIMSYLHHSSPAGHDEHPPPQSAPYYGAYGVSVPSEPADHYMLHNAAASAPLDGGMRMLQADMNGSSYTHRPLAPLGPASSAAAAPPMTTLLLPSLSQQQQPPYRRELHHQMPFPKLSPSQGRRPSLPSRRDSGRTNSNRVRKSKKDSTVSPKVPTSAKLEGPPPPPTTAIDSVEYDGPDEEVTLDDQTPPELRRLWDLRKQFLGKKGNGMWDEILEAYQGQENNGLSENKKTQVKASLQMKIHRMLLKHGKWPTRDEAALLRAYKRFEENRYVEILRLFEEEMAGRKKAYEWKSQHIEAQLVKMGLEEAERDRDSRARKRKQVAARHQPRSSTVSVLQQQQQQQQHGIRSLPQQRLPTMYGNPYGAQHYMHPQPTSYETRVAYENDLAALGAQPPVMTEEQHARFVDDIMERNPFVATPEQSEDADTKMGGYSHSGGNDLQARPRSHSAAPLLPMNGVVPMDPSPPQHQHLHHSLTAASSPDINAQRSAAVARQVCDERLNKQPYGPAVGA